MTLSNINFILPNNAVFPINYKKSKSKVSENKSMYEKASQ